MVKKLKYHGKNRIACITIRPKGEFEKFALFLFSGSTFLRLASHCHDKLKMMIEISYNILSKFQKTGILLYIFQMIRRVILDVGQKF